MLFNCGVAEDSWESLGLQGDSTSPSWRKSVLNIHWKDWCWSWNSNTLVTWCEELTHLKRPDSGKDWRQEEKGMTEDEIFGWHHHLNGHEFEQASGVGDREAWFAAVHGVTKHLTQLSDWTELNWTWTGITTENWVCGKCYSWDLEKLKGETLWVLMSMSVYTGVG